jgi:hypothetical protein
MLIEPPAPPLPLPVASPPFPASRCAELSCSGFLGGFGGLLIFALGTKEGGVLALDGGCGAGADCWVAFWLVVSGCFCVACPWFVASEGLGLGQTPHPKTAVPIAIVEKIAVLNPFLLKK